MIIFIYLCYEKTHIHQIKMQQFLGFYSYNSHKILNYINGIINQNPHLLLVIGYPTSQHMQSTKKIFNIYTSTFKLVFVSQI